MNTPTEHIDKKPPIDPFLLGLGKPNFDEIKPKSAAHFKDLLKKAPILAERQENIKAAVAELDVEGNSANARSSRPISVPPLPSSRPILVPPPSSKPTIKSTPVPVAAQSTASISPTQPPTLKELVERAETIRAEDPKLATALAQTIAASTLPQAERTPVSAPAVGPAVPPSFPVRNDNKPMAPLPPPPARRSFLDEYAKDNRHPTSPSSKKPPAIAGTSDRLTPDTPISVKSATPENIVTRAGKAHSPNDITTRKEPLSLSTSLGLRDKIIPDAFGDGYMVITSKDQNGNPKTSAPLYRQLHVVAGAAENGFTTVEQNAPMPALPQNEKLSTGGIVPFPDYQRSPHEINTAIAIDVRRLVDAYSPSDIQYVEKTMRGATDIIEAANDPKVRVAFDSANKQRQSEAMKDAISREEKRQNANQPMLNKEKTLILSLLNPNTIYTEKDNQRALEFDIYQQVRKPQGMSKATTHESIIQFIDNLSFDNDKLYGDTSKLAEKELARRKGLFEQRKIALKQRFSEIAFGTSQAVSGDEKRTGKAEAGMTVTERFKNIPSGNESSANSTEHESPWAKLAGKTPEEVQAYEKQFIPNSQKGVLAEQPQAKGFFNRLKEKKGILGNIARRLF